MGFAPDKNHYDLWPKSIEAEIARICRENILTCMFIFEQNLSLLMICNAVITIWHSVVNKSYSSVGNRVFVVFTMIVGSLNSILYKSSPWSKFKFMNIVQKI